MFSVLKWAGHSKASVLFFLFLLDLVWGIGRGADEPDDDDGRGADEPDGRGADEPGELIEVGDGAGCSLLANIVRSG